MTDAEAVENARKNEALLGGEFGRELPPDPTPEKAWAYVNELWEGDPGGRGWPVRVPAGATWLSLRDDEDDAGRGGGPEPTFGVRRTAPRQGHLEERRLLIRRDPLRQGELVVAPPVTSNGPAL